jgi:hypothetical protein
VPQELLFDQMRSVVIDDDRMSKGALVMNAESYALQHTGVFGLEPAARIELRPKVGSS